MYLLVNCVVLLTVTCVLCENYDEDLVDKESDTKGKPLFVQLIFRHGDRTPITYYQNDPWKDPKHWEVEPGQLTSLGKQQQFELGKWLQNRYSKLLNETYSSDQIYVSSSDFPRTIMSAEAVLAAMFQSTDYILKTYLPWQPIPVHVIPLEDDYLVAGDAECAIWNKYCKEFLETEENKQFYDRHQPLYDYLSLHAGEKVTRHSPITIRDTLKIEQMYNKTLPDWTKRILAGGDLHSSIEEVSLHSFKLDTSAPSLAKIKGGFLLKDILDRFTNKSKSILEPDRSMWMYSGHDTTIIRILNILGVQESLPPYSACVIFEMRQIDDVPNIQIFFKNSSAIPKLLHIPNCGVLCPLSSFYNLYKDVLPTKAFKEECKDDNAEASCASRVLMQALPAVLSILLTRLISTK